MFINRGMDRKDVVYLMEYQSAIKKNEIMQLAATQMDLETHTERSQTEERYGMTALYMSNLKRNDTNELFFTEQNQTHRIREQMYVSRGKDWGKGQLGSFLIDMCTCCTEKG